MNKSRFIGSSAGVVALFAMVIFALFSSDTVRAQDLSQDPQILLSEAKEAIRNERYDLAMDILMQGKVLFPGTAEIPLALGTLFFEREIYSRALKEFQAAELIDGENREILNNTALTLGHLGREKEAAQYYERVRSLFPEDRDAVNDLGWMYFKTHQLFKGEQILKEGIDKFGINRRFAMTLGTIYADLYDYENAKKYYGLSIAEAKKDMEFRFASVAYYNLSLLEKSFYHYDSALEFTARSLQMEERASGHLARGELYEGRRYFAGALAEYKRAEILDTTPLSRMNLASLYRKFGFLQEALVYAEDVKNQRDFSWMYYFGTSRNRYLMDLHEIFHDIFSGLARLKKSRTEPGLLGVLTGSFRRLKYHLLSTFHRLQYNRYASRVALTYRQENNLLNAWFTYSLAHRNRTRTTLRYLFRARDIEVTISPEAERFYQLEEAKIRRDPDMLLQAEKRFVVPWEKENIEDALRYLIPSLEIHKRFPEAREATVRLFRINPGAIRQYGLHLPVRISLHGFSNHRDSRRFQATLGIAGIGLPAFSIPPGEDLPVLKVEIMKNGGSAWILTGAGLSADGSTSPLSRTSRHWIDDLAQAVADGIFRIIP